MGSLWQEMETVGGKGDYAQAQTATEYQWHVLRYFLMVLSGFFGLLTLYLVRMGYIQHRREKSREPLRSMRAQQIEKEIQLARKRAAMLALDEEPMSDGSDEGETLQQKVLVLRQSVRKCAERRQKAEEEYFVLKAQVEHTEQQLKEAKEEWSHVQPVQRRIQPNHVEEWKAAHQRLEKAKKSFHAVQEEASSPLVQKSAELQSVEQQLAKYRGYLEESKKTLVSLQERVDTPKKPKKRNRRKKKKKKEQGVVMLRKPKKET